MHNVAVYIPAKAHSTGVPAKNLADLDSKPLVAWSIASAKELVADRTMIFVSTDDTAIRAIACDDGCTVLDRPADLASSTARVAECLAHDLPAIEARIGPDGIIAVFLPTSPFRNTDAIRKAIQQFENSKEKKSLVSVRPFPAPVAQAMTLDEKTGQLASIEPLDSLNARSRRQQHSAAYYPDGSLYLVRVGHFRSDPRFFIAGATLGFVSDRFSSIDIDNPDDLEFARWIAAVRIERDRNR